MPILMEWVLLITISTPAALANRAICRRNPRLALTLWFTAFLSAGIAAAAALGISVWVVFETWLSLNHNTAGSLQWFEALAVSFLPWLFLALGGIAMALASQRLTPELSAAKNLSATLSQGLRPTDEFAGYSVAILEVPVLVAFTTRLKRKPLIVISRAATQMLTQSEVEAVLWHEVGHIRGRHNALRRIANLVCTLAPFVPASEFLRQEVFQLTELEADRWALTKCQPSALGAAKSRFDF